MIYNDSIPSAMIQGKPICETRGAISLIKRESYPLTLGSVISQYKRKPSPDTRGSVPSISVAAFPLKPFPQYHGKSPNKKGQPLDTRGATTQCKGSLLLNTYSVPAGMFPLNQMILILAPIPLDVFSLFQ